MKLVDLVKDARVHEHRVLLWPRRWKLYQELPSVAWQVSQFRETSAKHIPDAPGVYVFLLQPGIASKLDASYVMYVGMTDRSLRLRFREYLQEVRGPLGRPKIIMLLSLYRQYLHFCCSAVISPNRPEAIENELLQAFIPPGNERYPASIRRVVAAFT